MGSVAFQPWMMELAGKGGPVGELVQWTDIIAALYVLGHDVKVVSNDTQLPYGPFVSKIWVRMGIKAVVKSLDSQSRGPAFKTAGWLQGR